MSDGLRLLIVLALVAGNAFFVIGEYSIITARRAALASRAEGGGAGARAALRLMDDPVKVISTVQVGITGISILIGAVGEPLVRDLLGGGLPAPVSFTIAFAVVTYLSVVLGELVPKALTLQRSESLAILIARPIELLSRMLRPVVWVLDRSAGVFLRPFGITEVTAGESIRSAEELRALVDEAEESGLIPRAQEEMLHKVFSFAGREVADAMRAAPDVEWLEADLRPTAALDRTVGLGHSRFPLGEGTLDRLAGFVHVRDLVAAERERPDATMRDLARTLPVVPPTKDLGAMLRELREGHCQMAAVLDEYGGTLGIITIEDILEELVGEIEDEYDLPDATMEWTGPQEVRVAGSLTIDDFNETLGTTLPQRGPRTLAGLAFDALGHRPEPGEAVDVDDVRLTVEAMDGHRITRLRVDLPDDAGRPEPEAGS
jgi:putative hemolysin